MVLKSYFDGSNQADSSQYDRISIAVVCGGGKQWKKFDNAWRKVLYRHRVDYLHTTDAVSLQGEFTKERGWSNERVDIFISECVDVIRSNMATPPGWHGKSERPGLFPKTLTIPFDDWVRAKKETLGMPDTIEDLCASESVAFALKWGTYIDAKKYELFFDRGEPFFGHTITKWRHPKVQKDVELMKDIIHVGESISRETPALQMADLFAWCVNRANQERRKWHIRLHDLPWDSRLLDYEHLINPNPLAVERMAKWKLPPRQSSVKNLSKPKKERPK